MTQRPLKQDVNIVKLIKAFISSKFTYYLIFQIPEIEEKLIHIIQQYSFNLKLYIPRKFLQDVENVEEQNEKIKYYHGDKTGHRGYNRSQNILSNKYYWSKLVNDVTDYINSVKSARNLNMINSR